jgi:hypothetical protein
MVSPQWKEGSMKHALGVAAVVLVLAARSASAAQVPAAGTGQEKVATAKAGRTTRRAMMVKLKPLDQGTVRRALDLALATLASPGCAQVYGDFELPTGGTPQGELDRMAIGPKEFLETLVFTDGGREPVCRMGQAALAMKPGTRLVFVCPRFAAFQIANARMSASVIIHESLHALGLGENPPSSNEITQRVERRCWKLAKAAHSSKPTTASPPPPCDTTSSVSVLTAPRPTMLGGHSTGHRDGLTLEAPHAVLSTAIGWDAL